MMRKNAAPMAPILGLALLATSASAQLRGVAPVPETSALSAVSASASVAPAIPVTAAAVSLTPLLAAPVPAAISAAPALFPTAAARPEAAAASPVSGETAKQSSDRLFDAVGDKDGGAPSVAVAAVPAAAPRPLARPSAADERGPSGAPRPAASKAAPSWLQSLKDRKHHAVLLAQNYYWYSVTHIISMWPSYLKRWSEAAEKSPAVVSRPRGFFSSMRVAATSGRFYVLGAAPMEDDASIVEFRSEFRRWFDGPGIGEEQRAALDRFMARAKSYNAERRAPSNMRKNIRDAMIKASTMRAEEIAPYLDSLMSEESAHETWSFQNKGAQKRIMDAFQETLLSVLDQEPAEVRGRVIGAIVLGSFASGSAGPKSDFDVELVTEGADLTRVKAFAARLTQAWKDRGYHATNPVSVHDFPSPPSRGAVDLVHFGDYVVVSRDASLVAALSRAPGEGPKFQMIRALSARGRVNRAVQLAVIHASTRWADLKARLGAAPSSGH